MSAADAPSCSTVRQLLTTIKQLKYYHSDAVTPEILDACRGKALIFEIDVAVSSDTSFKYTVANKPYIGHPSQFYDIPGRPFPEQNVTIDEFKQYVLKPENRTLKILFDIKNIEVLGYVIEFAKEVGAGRCLAHAFIREWTKETPEGIETHPHWVAEDMPLAILDEKLTEVGIPLIANCRAFNNEHVAKHGLIDEMARDAKQYKSVAALGLYLKESHNPKLEYLRAFNDAGYYAWINSNNDIAPYEDIRWVGMCDDMDRALLPETSTGG